MGRLETIRTRATIWPNRQGLRRNTRDGKKDSGPSGGEVHQHLSPLQQSPHTIETKMSQAGQGSNQEGKGPGGCLSLLDEEKREDVFLILFLIFC